MQKPSSRHDCKQWLADNGISDKSYYYWLRKIRLEAYEQLNIPAVTQSAEVSFAEIPLPINEDHSSDWNESVATPVAVIKCGNLSIGLSNDISEELLHRLLKEESHAGRYKSFVFWKDGRFSYISFKFRIQKSAKI